MDHVVVKRKVMEPDWSETISQTNDEKSQHSSEVTESDVHFDHLPPALFAIVIVLCFIIPQGIFDQDNCSVMQTRVFAGLTVCDD